MLRLDEETVRAIRERFGANISRLRLGGNGIRDLDRVADLEHLVQLSLRNNSILDLRPLRPLIHLTDLDLGQNQISQLDGLETLANLEVLDLSENKLQSIRDLQSLAPLAKLRCLFLRGNPLTLSGEFPRAVFALVPSLQEVDSHVRSPAKVQVVSAGAEADESAGEAFALRRALEIQEQALAANVTAVVPDPHAKFPFEALLQRWRSEVVKQHLQGFRRAQEDVRRSARDRLERDQATSHVRDLDAQVVKLSELRKAESAKAVGLEKALRALQDSHGSLAKRCQEAESAKDQAVMTLRRLATRVERMFRDQEAAWRAMDRGARSLAQQSARVAAATEHAQFLDEALRQRHVHLRNTEAALAAKQLGAGQVGEEDAVALCLPAEAEACLRGVFCAVDGADQGIVPSDVLAEVLAEDGLAALLGRALGEEAHARLMSALRAWAGDVTLGELLLLLLPAPARRPSTLPAGDVRALRTLRLLGDDAALVPALDPHSRSGAAPQSVVALSREVAVLRGERAHLLQRLQQLSRQLQVRAEGIHAYFEQDLRGRDLRIQDLQQQLRDAEAEGQRRADRVAALEEDARRLRGEHEAARQEWADREQRLVAELETRRLGLSEVAESSGQRCARAEAEVAALQRESGRQGVRIKAMEREAAQLKALLASQSSAADDARREASQARQQREEVEQARETLHAALREAQAEAAALRASSAAAQAADASVPALAISSAAPQSPPPAVSNALLAQMTLAPTASQLSLQLEKLFAVADQLYSTSAL